jgi:hypothetical protein
MRRSDIDPVPFATAALLYVSLMPVGWAESLTLDQQIAELKNSNGGSPVEIKQSQPDFLAGAYYLEVEVLAPYHPRFSNYVFRADKGIYSADLLDDLHRLPTELGISIKCRYGAAIRPVAVTTDRRIGLLANILLARGAVGLARENADVRGIRAEGEDGDCGNGRAARSKHGSRRLHGDAARGDWHHARTLPCLYWPGRNVVLYEDNTGA